MRPACYKSVINAVRQWYRRAVEVRKINLPTRPEQGLHKGVGEKPCAHLNYELKLMLLKFC